MPPRWFCYLIIASWLAVNGWLLFHDLLPRLLPGQPPVYAIELVEEAQTNRTYASWSVTMNGEKTAFARTRIEHPAHDRKHPKRDLYELIAELRPHALVDPNSKTSSFPAEGILVQQLTSKYLVDDSGNLVGLEVQVTGQFDLRALMPEAEFPPVDLFLNGDVRSGYMNARLKGQLPPFLLKGQRLDLDLPAIPIESGETLLMPLHPVNRHRVLVPGQTWQVHMLDPLAWSRKAFGAVQGLAADLPLLHARVLDEEKWIRNGRYGQVPCQEIEYEGDHVKISTWVSRQNGLVMYQEATLDKTTWVMQRE